MSAGANAVSVDVPLGGSPSVTEAWVEAGSIDAVPRRGARVVRTRHGDVAVFRTARDRVFALRNQCPHLGGPLSEGIVHDEHVTCPLHNWVIGLADGEAQGADEGCTAVVELRIEDGRIWLDAVSLQAAFGQ